MVKNILILEDFELALESLSVILQKNYGNTVNIHKATSYYEALEIVESSAIDVFILDVELGRGQKSGLDLAKKLRSSKKYKSTGIVFTTADAMAWRTAVNQFHCYAYITKPYKTKELLDALDSLLLGYEANPPTSETLSDQEKNTVINMDAKNFHLDDTMYRINLTATGKTGIRIKLSDIIYLESRQSKTFVYTINEDDECIVTKFLPLLKFMEDMNNTYGNDSYFYQCKNCYIVNTNYCRYYDATQKSLILTHGDKEYIVDVKREFQLEAKSRFPKEEVLLR